MRRGVFVSSLLIAGSALCAPAFAQTQDKPVEAPTAPAAAPAPAVKAEAPAPQPKPAKPKPAKPEPLLATPNGQVMDKARELAEADLAAAPDEEVKPLRVDPNLARKRDFALPKPAPKPVAEDKPALAERAQEPLPAVAEAKAEPKPAAEPKPVLAEAAPATPAIIDEEQPVVAEREPVRGRDPVVKPVYAQRRYETETEADPAPAADEGDPVVRPTYRQRRWEPRQVEQAARAPAAAVESRPDYAEAERIVREANARADGEPLPAAEAGRMAEAAPPAPEPAAAETAEVAEASPVARPGQSAEAAAVEDAPPVTDAAEEAGDSARDVLRDASRATRVIRQAGRVAKALGGAAVGAAADAPVLADDEEREERPVYAEEDREGERMREPVYAEDEREADRGYDRAPRREAPVYADDARDDREAPVYAEERRAYPPVYERPYRQRVGYPERWTSRLGADSCDSHRYEGLARAVRRAAEIGSIDWRTARDMEEEIAHGASMQRSYCESGMNDWRERRLDDQYAQIEDRLRYERRRFR